MKIAFTSCVRYEAFKKQPEWNDILKQNPDYLFLLGDNIYMDYGLKFLSKEPNGAPKKYPASKFKAIMEQKYHNQFNAVPEFKTLVQHMRSKNGFYGIWDDHDFGWNNIKGAEMCAEKRDISVSLFHKYFKCSTNLPHTYYHVDLPHARAIFIDNRIDAKGKGKKETDRLISEEQFQFIEKMLDHDLKYTLLCGGITLTKGGENWCNYPKQIKRLCELLKNKQNVFFLAGDIHKNKFVKPKKLKRTNICTPVQLISSGLQINYLGLGISWDDRHNWALLDLTDNTFKISFYNKRGYQKKKSRKATDWIVKNYINKFDCK